MKFEMRQSFQIESARFLPHLAKNHPCHNIHGHSFKITLIWTGAIDKHIGWVIDYHEVTEKFEPIRLQLDHKLLNEVIGLENPTSEYISFWIYEKVKTFLPTLDQVIISETSTTECRYPCRHSDN